MPYFELKWNNITKSKNVDTHWFENGTRKKRNNKICASPTTTKSTPMFEAAWLTHRGEKEEETSTVKIVNVHLQSSAEWLERAHHINAASLVCFFFPFQSAFVLFIICASISPVSNYRYIFIYGDFRCNSKRTHSNVIASEWCRHPTRFFSFSPSDHFERHSVQFIFFVWVLFFSFFDDFKWSVL